MSRMGEVFSRVLDLSGKAKNVIVGELKTLKSIIVEKEVTDLDVLKSQLKTASLENVVLQSRIDDLEEKVIFAESEPTRIAKLQNKLKSCHDAFLKEYPTLECNKEHSLEPCSICYPSLDHNPHCLCVHCFKTLGIKE